MLPLWRHEDPGQNHDAQRLENGDIVWEYVNPHFYTHEKLGSLNWLLRARRYLRDGPELEGRL